MIAATHGLGWIRRPDGFVSLTCTCVLSLLYYPYLCCTTLVLESSVGLTLVAIEKKSVEIKSYSKTTVYSEDIQKDRESETVTCTSRDWNICIPTLIVGQVEGRMMNTHCIQAIVRSVSGLG